MGTCVINSGKNRNCKNTSGVKAIYIANYPDNVIYKEDFLTFDGEGQVIEISGTTTELVFYPFITDDTLSNFEEKYINNAYEQKITLALPSLNQENQNLIKQLLSGSFIIITKFKNNTYWMTGIVDSMGVTEGHGQSGKDITDYNGYELVITAYENTPAPQVKPSALIIDPPIADFTYTKTEKTVIFTNTSTGATNYLWDFGDGETSISINPTHIYSEYGDFFVSLSVFNISGVDKIIKMIPIEPLPIVDFTYLINDDTVTFINETEYGDTYLWDFGDGTTSTDENPVRIYNYGEYDVSLTAYNSVGDNFITKHIIVLELPIANFTYVINDETVTLTNTSIHTDHYLWDFGDGTTSTDTNPVHVYANYQEYTITLNAYNSYGDIDIKIEQIETLIPPVANFTYIIDDETVTFTNTSTDATSYLWDFGDGETSTETNPIHVYLISDDYDVSLTAYNINENDLIIKNITVLLPPVSDFIINPHYNTKTITFTNTSVDAVTYEWDFGDSSGSTQENPTHIYNDWADYDVKLTVHNSVDDDIIIKLLVIHYIDFSTSISDHTATFTNNSENFDHYLWEFGDGTTSTDISPIHTYSTYGSYDVVLKAYSIQGDESILINNINIIQPLTVADFTYVIDDKSIIFTNTSIEANTYLWDFGDGNTSTLENPTHIYSGYGNYTVSLTTYNTVNQDTKIDTINTLIIQNNDIQLEYFIPSDNYTVIVPTNLINDYKIDWGDGVISHISLSGNPQHMYSNSGTYDVIIEGGFTSFDSDGQVLSYITKINKFKNKNTLTTLTFNKMHIKSIDLSETNITNMVDISNMFFRCYYLTSLDVSGFDTSNVTNMSDMFSGCQLLTPLDVSGFDTSNVTDMSNMFSTCESLTSLNLMNFNTSNVTDMSGMFYFCFSLNGLGVGNFDTSNVTYMYSMFYNCASLNGLGVGNFDTSNVVDMSYMFGSCDSLTSLDVTNFDTSNVTYMYGMFRSSDSLTSLNLSNFNTSNVTNMYGMFESCGSLTSLNLSNFNTSSVGNMDSMFMSCGNNLCITANNNFITNTGTSTTYMFNSSSILHPTSAEQTSLVNANGYVYTYTGC